MPKGIKGFQKGLLREKSSHWKNGLSIDNPKEYKKLWRLKNIDKVKIQEKKDKRLYYIRHKDKIMRLNKLWLINHPNWFKEWRHKTGRCKKYNTGFSKTKKYKRLQRQKRKALLKGGGELSLKRIQMVYEDNIKQYGTLTCYLCLKSIPFGKDHLEHKIPLCRNGTNEYNNLAIACQKCNCKKHKKTETEFKKEIL